MRGLEGVPGLPGAPQDEAGLTRIHGEMETMGVDMSIQGDSVERERRAWIKASSRQLLRLQKGKTLISFKNNFWE